jgi:hypothetical protein
VAALFFCNKTTPLRYGKVASRALKSTAVLAGNAWRGGLVIEGVSSHLFLKETAMAYDAFRGQSRMAADDWLTNPAMSTYQALINRFVVDPAAVLRSMGVFLSPVQAQRIRKKVQLDKAWGARAAQLLIFGYWDEDPRRPGGPDNGIFGYWDEDPRRPWGSVNQLNSSWS